MLLEIDGRRYPVVAMERLELRHVVLLQRELQQNPGITALSTWSDIRHELGAWGNLTGKQREHHPEALFFTALTVWSARVSAGEDLSLLDAISVPVSAIHWIVEPGDRQAGEGEGKAHRPAGSRGAGRSGGKRKRAKPRT